MKKVIVTFCVVFSIISFFFLFNSEPVKFNMLTAKDKFSISVPEYLTKTDSMDPAALLQYKNEEEQLFLLVYEKKDTLMQPIATYFKKLSDNLISKMSRGNLLKYYPKQLNG